jgi:hypothetical protein
MPLVHGHSPTAIATNIARERHAGASEAQAVAIAYERARRDWRARHPRGPYPAHLRGLRRPRGRHNRSEGSGIAAPAHPTSGLDFETFNTALAKAFGRLKKDAGAETIRQNYRGTGSQKAVRQIFVRFKSGAVVDLWLRHGVLEFGGVVARGGGGPPLPRGVAYQGRTVEQIYQEALGHLQPWANPRGLANQARPSSHGDNRARPERLAKPLDTRTVAKADVHRVLGHGVEYLLTVWITAPTSARAEDEARQFGKVRDVFVSHDPDGTRHATAIAEGILHGLPALDAATAGIDRFLVPPTPGSPHTVEGTRRDFLAAAKRRPPWVDAATWRANVARHRGGEG